MKNVRAIKDPVLEAMRTDSRQSEDVLAKSLKNLLPDASTESIRNEVHKIVQDCVQSKVGIINPKILMEKRIYPYFIFVVADDYRKFRHLIEEGDFVGSWFSLYGYDDYLCKVYCSPKFFDQKILPELEKHGTVSFFRVDNLYVESGFEVQRNFKMPDSTDEDNIKMLQSDCASHEVHDDIKDALLERSILIGYGILETHVNTGSILAYVGVKLRRGTGTRHLRTLVRHLNIKSGQFRKYITGLYEGWGKIKDYDLVIEFLLPDYYYLNRLTEDLYNVKGIDIDTFTHLVAEPVRLEIPCLDSLYHFEEGPEDISEWANKVLEEIYDSLPSEVHPTLRKMDERIKAQIIARYLLLSDYKDCVTKPRNVEACSTAVKQFLNGMVTRKGTYFAFTITRVASALETELYDTIKFNGEIAIGPEWEQQLKKELSQPEDRPFSLGSFMKIIEHWKSNYGYCSLGITDSEYGKLTYINKYRKPSVHGKPLAKVEALSDKQIEEYTVVLSDALKLILSIEGLNIKESQSENRYNKFAAVSSYFFRKISGNQRELVIPTLEKLASELKEHKLTVEEILERLNQMEESAPKSDRPMFRRVRNFLATAASEGVIEEAIGLILRAALKVA